MFKWLFRVYLISSVSITLCSGCFAELPVLHLRKASSPPQLVTTLQDPSNASGWYGASPAWFGLGGKTGDRNHTEVLATYDSNALYIAFMNIDRATVLYPRASSVSLALVDSNAVWIQTPAGRKFYLIAAMDDSYPPAPKQASGEFPAIDYKTDKLAGWAHSGWQAGGMSVQQTLRIPWSTLHTSAPVSGSRWRINFVNYNQTSTSLSSAYVKKQSWAPGTESQPDQWGYIAFDEAAYSAPNISPEAVLTLRPAAGYGSEVTLRAGNGADQTNGWSNEAITQSNWNDWDPVDFTIKEYMQFDLSMIPRGRKIISAKLQNRFRDNYNSDSSDLYLHAVRLAQPYDSAAVTMLTSPLPVENGSRTLVKASDAGKFIDIDVSDIVSKAFDSGLSKVSLALAGSSGDIHNGKIWDVSYGYADWYDIYRPRLVITFGKPGAEYNSPLSIGTFNYTSVAQAWSKNKITNGTFKYGTLEGISNTTYWLDPGSISWNGRNLPIMQKLGDVNPNTGHPAVRFNTNVAWKGMRQIAAGIVGGKTYTFSGWYKGSAAGIKSDIYLEMRDAAGNALSSGCVVYSGSGKWEKLVLSVYAPAGAVQCLVQSVNYTSADNTYMLYSDFQLEAGTTPTAYSETMGIFYPDYPRAGVSDKPAGAFKSQSIGSYVSIAGQTVTVVSDSFFYVQSPEAGGIKVISKDTPPLGTVIDVTGTLGHDSNDELVINALSILPSGVDPASVKIKPFFCVNRAVGGGSYGNMAGPDGGIGINNVGSLVATSGKVKSLSAGQSMIIDDGSGFPISIYGPTGSAVQGKYIRVIGVVGIEKVNGAHKPVVHTRKDNDTTAY